MPLITTSWDDGHPSDLRVGALLEKHGLSGTFYVPTRNIEGRSVMVAEQVRRLGQRFEIGGHTWDHVNLVGYAPRQAAEQITSNKAWLEDVTGREVSGFAYVRGHHDATIRRLVHEAGFRYARTVRNLCAAPGADPFQAPTTIQFFNHPRDVYIRNYLAGGPTLRRLSLLLGTIGSKDLGRRMRGAAESALNAGRDFHLWGHSWELDEYGLWEELDRFLGQLRRLSDSFVTNAAWCSRAGQVS